MLKKILIILAVLLVCSGIGYLGYVIFMSKNIDNVELVGNMQTIYFVGDDIDYEDAQLKVTYKNGNMQLLNLKDVNPTVTLFTTSIKAHGKMKITYKNFTIEQEYNVFEKGSYYVDSTNTTYAGSGDSVSAEYTLNNTTTLYAFLGNGKLRYYHKDNTDWYMNDGKYDTRYSYEMVGDKIILRLGETNTLELKAVYHPDGKLYLASTKVDMNANNPSVPSVYTNSTYNYYAMGDRIIDSSAGTCEIAYEKTNIGSSNKFIKFKEGETFNTIKTKVYLKIVYVNENIFMKTVYVEICDQMNNDPDMKLDTTSRITSTPYPTRIFYGDSSEGSVTLRLDYTVEQNNN